MARVTIANPLQVKAIAKAHVKTDKIDAGTLASLQAAGYLPQIWTPDAETERKRRMVARRYQVVRHRTWLKNEMHSILHAHLIPKCPHTDLFNARGRSWLAAQQLLDDERAAIDRHVRELDRLAEDLALLDREIAQDAIEDSAVNRAGKPSPCRRSRRRAATLGSWRSPSCPSPTPGRRPSASKRPARRPPAPRR